MCTHLKGLLWQEAKVREAFSREMMMFYVDSNLVMAMCVPGGLLLLPFSSRPPLGLHLLFSEA